MKYSWSRIAGWKHKEHPLLYNVLHIGDLVLSIAGISLTGATSVKDILKNYTLPRVSMETLIILLSI